MNTHRVASVFHLALRLRGVTLDLATGCAASEALPSLSQNPGSRVSAASC